MTEALRVEEIDHVTSFGTDPNAADVDATGALQVAYRAGAIGAGVTHLSYFRDGRVLHASHGPR